MRRVAALLLPLLLVEPVALTEGISPTQLIYEGAFRVPQAGFAFGGHVACATPEGTLLLSGSLDKQLVGELQIPTLDPANRDIPALPVAALQGPLFDPTDGVRLKVSTDTGKDYRLRGLAVKDGRLYSTIWIYYNVANSDYPFLVRANRDGTGAQGPVRVTPMAAGPEDRNHSNKIAGYLVVLTPRLGSELLAGASPKEGGGRQSASNGPAFYSFSVDRWPPPNARSLLLFTLKHPDVDFSPADRWWGAGCLDDGLHHALLVIGRKALGPAEAQPYPPDFDVGGNGFSIDPFTKRLVYYGKPIPGVHASPWKGYHGDPYEGHVWFYDRRKLKRPYSVWHPAELFGHPLGEISGCTSTDGQRLFISELDVDGRRPVVHVWHLP